MEGEWGRRIGRLDWRPIHLGRCRDAEEVKDRRRHVDGRHQPGLASGVRSQGIQAPSGRRDARGGATGDDGRHLISSTHHVHRGNRRDHDGERPPRPERGQESLHLKPNGMQFGRSGDPGHDPVCERARNCSKHDFACGWGDGTASYWPSRQQRPQTRQACGVTGRNAERHQIPGAVPRHLRPRSQCQVPRTVRVATPRLGRHQGRSTARGERPDLGQPHELLERGAVNDEQQDPAFPGRLRGSDNLGMSRAGERGDPGEGDEEEGRSGPGHASGGHGDGSRCTFAPRAASLPSRSSYPRSTW